MKVLRGGQVFIDGVLQRVDLAFDEQIRAIGPDLRDHPGAQAIDVERKLVLPGMIDAHVHFRDFNQAHKEDWQSVARAALKGGVTTVVEMPNTDPPTVTLKMLREKRKRAEASGIRFGLFGGLVETNVQLIEELAKEAIAFKLYLGETTGGLIVRDPGALKEIFAGVAESGKILAVHAQDSQSRSEAKDLEPALAFADRYRAKLHLCHCRMREGIELALEAKRDGLDLTIETCPHYLYFTEDDFQERGALLKVNPPLASATDREYLWDALARGQIDILGSDHAPHTLAEKAQPLERAPYGLPGVETTLSLMLDAVAQKKLRFGRLIEVFAINPAQRFGLSGRGRIAVGNDADLTIIDLGRHATIKRVELATKCGWSPFEGFSLTGWPVMTFIGGQNVYMAPVG
jgi:dihydroorotase